MKSKLKKVGGFKLNPPQGIVEMFTVV